MSRLSLENSRLKSDFRGVGVGCGFLENREDKILLPAAAAAAAVSVYCLTVGNLDSLIAFEMSESLSSAAVHLKNRRKHWMPEVNFADVGHGTRYQGARGID